MSLQVVESSFGQVPNNSVDCYLKIADFILAHSFTSLYTKYLSTLNKISDLIIDSEEILQDNYVNYFHNKNEILVKKLNLDLKEIFYKLNEMIFSEFEKSNKIEDYNTFIQLGYEVLLIIDTYDYDYYLENANKEWLIRKSKIEYYLEKNINLFAETSCKKISWIGAIIKTISGNNPIKSIESWKKDNEDEIESHWMSNYKKN